MGALTTFVDTSAWLALVDADEERHGEAAAAWRSLLERDAPLVTTSYVLVETYALAQRRLGQAAVRVLADDLLPVAEVEFVGRDAHDRAIAAVIAANRRDLSLVDAVSFDVMRRRGIFRAFAFDRHFTEAGFSPAGPE
jgi:predicted nucleic acid-binding protein